MAFTKQVEGNEKRTQRCSPQLTPTLSARLATIRRCIGAAPLLIDVGTDHALLPLSWLGSHPQSRALGIDRGELPLQRAQQNREKSLEGSRLELRLQSGLGTLVPPPNAVLSICGMGGLSIQEILCNAVAVRQHQLARVVLGPNDRFDAVRTTLSRLGWRIYAEDALWERERFYPVIQAAPCPAAPETLDALALHFGPQLLKDAHPALGLWLHRHALRLRQIQARMAPKCPPAELLAHLKAIQDAWNTAFQNQYGALESPHGLTAAQATKQTN